MASVEHLVAEFGDFQVVVFIIGDLEQSHLQQLQQVGIPFGITQVMPHAKGLEPVVAFLDDVGLAHAAQDVGNGVHACLLTGAHDGAQCHLGEASAVEALGRVVAHVAVVAVVVKALVEVAEQDATAAHAALGKLLHAAQLVHVDLHLT